MHNIKQFLIRCVIVIFIGTVFILGVMVGKDSPEAEPVSLDTAQAETVQYISEPPEPQPEMIYMGEFTITGYCPCAICCGEANKATKSGVMPTAGQTVGADWSILPVGTEIYIEGIGYRVVEDKPSDKTIQRYNGKIIDVFCATHKEAQAVGKRVVKVYIIK